ncbi:YhdP family protein [Halopseudomonas sp.]|uniref:YhdP family protein n=1 Tax=Halopseudomonas sp. TaxID=2901191 RepID=UPI00356A6151
MPSQRWLIRILDGLIVMLVVWLLAAAAYVSLGRQFVPAIADYREELLTWAQENTGRFISLDELRGEMQGWQPVLEMRGLRVHEQHDPASPTLLALDNVTARIDVWTSLWQRQLVMDALQIEGLELELIEDARGRWRLHGLGARPAGDYDLDAGLKMLFEQRRITLLDTRIVISPEDRPQWVFREGQITLLNGPGWHRLDGRVDLPEGRSVSWQFSALPDGDRWQDMSVGFYIDLPPIDWAEQLPQSWLELVRLDQIVAGGQFWGGWQGQQLQYLRGRLDAPLVRLEQEPGMPGLRDLVAEFALDLGERQRLRVQGLSFDLGEQQWPVSRMTFQRDTTSKQWQFQADRLSLGLLAQMVPTQRLPERASAALASLAPSGALTAVSLQGSGSASDWQSISLSTMLDDVSVAAWQGAPAVQGISGSLIGSPARGELRVSSDDWTIHLPRLFPDKWAYQELVGRMNWQWSDSDGLRLHAPGMRIRGEEGMAAAALRLHLPLSDVAPTMELRVALNDSLARFSQRYLPTLSPAFNPRLARWLDQAEIDGNVPLAIFEYRGSLGRKATADERKLSLFAQFDSGSLEFDPRWPRLEQVSGILRLNNQHLLVDQAAARLWNTELADVRVNTDPELPGGLQLSVESDFSGPLQDALRLMQETPLAAATDDNLQGWTGEGQVQGRLELQFPLQAGGVPAVDSSWRLDAQSLSIPLLQASLHDLSGRFAYTSSTGLQAADLGGRFLGRTVSGAIDRQDGAQIATISGLHSIEELKGWPVLADLPSGLISGELPWRARGRVGAGITSLQIDSDLQGTTISLPGSLVKPAEQLLPSRLLLTLEGERGNWEFNLGPDLRGLVQTGATQLGGDIRYRSGVPALGTESGLSLQARFQQLDLAVWQQWFEEHRALWAIDSQDVASTESGERVSAAVKQVRTLDLRAENFTGLGQSLDSLAVSGVRGDQGWIFDIDQSRVRGQITLPDLRAEPIVVNMQRLNIARGDAQPRVDALASPLVAEDPLLGADPQALPLMDVNVDTLFWGSEPVGQLRFQMRPADAGARITGLDINLRGLKLAGDLDWYSAGPSSRFRGTLETGDIGEVLQAWGYAPTVTSRRFSTTADLSWPGSPAFFALNRSSGSLQLDARNGTLQSGEGSVGALRVFGLLNFNALTRRLRLDFSDLFGRGTAYDTLIADLALTDGVMRTRSPLVMDGPGAKMQLDGQIDLPARSIDMGMLVTLPVTNNLPLAAIIAGAPYIGGVLFLADKIFGDSVARFASVKYRVSGDWQQPTVEFDRAFDNEAALEE